jgi:hypothetical protein
MKPKTIAIASLLSLILVACAPALTIRHSDPSTKQIKILLDDQEEGVIEWGEDFVISLPDGVHSVNAVTAEDGLNIWSNDGRGWRIYLEEDAELVLLTPDENAGFGGHSDR